jgi:proteasome lid subunit RPN8/RPN11
VTRRLVLPAELGDRLVEHALVERPNECVGLLAGRGEVVERVYRLVNELSSPTRFFAAESLFAPMRDMRERGLHLLGVYHSHPAAPPTPSRRDVDENYYPDAVHVIISLLHDEPTLRGWLLSPEAVEEVELTSHSEQHMTTL